MRSTGRRSPTSSSPAAAVCRRRHASRRSSDAAVKYDYNPAKAKPLLAEAGYPNGFETELVSYILTQWETAVQNYLGEVGIKAKLSHVQVAAGIQRNQKGDIPLYLGSWGSYS